MNKALKALKEIEWMQVDGQIDDVCPVCKQFRSSHHHHTQECRLDRAIGLLEREQPTDAPTQAPEAELTYEQQRDIASKATDSPELAAPEVTPVREPVANRPAWDKMATASRFGESVNKATEAGEFTKEVRTALGKPPERLRPITDYLFEACDRLDRLEAQVKHTVDFCKVQIGMSLMAISAAADITGLSYKTVSDWPEIDTKDCKTFSEAYAKVKRIVEEQNGN